MTAREAAVAAVLSEHPQTSGFDELGDYFKYACGCSWFGDSDADHHRHVAAAIIAALDDTPTATTGAYPCCTHCGTECSGHHETPCATCQPGERGDWFCSRCGVHRDAHNHESPKCVYDPKFEPTTTAMLAIADEGHDRARGAM